MTRGLGFRGLDAYPFPFCIPLGQMIPRFAERDMYFSAVSGKPVGLLPRSRGRLCATRAQGPASHHVLFTSDGELT